MLISSNVYGGTFRVLDKIFKNFGIGYSIEDTTDLDATAAALIGDEPNLALAIPLL